MARAPHGTAAAAAGGLGATAPAPGKGMATTPMKGIATAAAASLPRPCRIAERSALAKQKETERKPK